MRRLEASPPMNGPAVSSSTTGSGAALIPDKGTKRGERIVRIEINSNDRDFKTYSNPADFQWVSPYPLKNITSMVIVGGTVPIPFYTIDTPYNSFIFDTGSLKKVVTLTPGQYTATNLPAALKTVLDAADGTNIYTVAIHPITQILSVTTNGSNQFGFLFGTGTNYLNLYNPALQSIGNPGYMLGFSNADVYSVTGTLTAPYATNLKPLQRIYLYLNYETSVDLRSVVLGGGRSGPSAILYCTDQDSVISYTKSLNKDTYENVISPGLILPRIRTIQISLRDEFGNVLNTNNRAVTFLLEVTVLE
jgi:hypothetical protein